MTVPASAPAQMTISRAWDRARMDPGLKSKLGFAVVALGYAATGFIVPLAVDYLLYARAKTKEPLIDSDNWEPKKRLAERGARARAADDAQISALGTSRQGTAQAPKEEPLTEAAFRTPASSPESVTLDTKHTPSQPALFNMQVQATRERAVIPNSQGTAKLAGQVLAGLPEGASTETQAAVRAHVQEGRWTEAVEALRPQSPQWLFATTMAELQAGSKDGKAGATADTSTPQQVVFPAQTLVPDNKRLNLAGFSLQQGHVAGALGSTYTSATYKAGTPFHCQDGIFCTPNSSVVADGLGGHSHNDADEARVTQTAAGVYLAKLMEVAGRDLSEPAAYLQEHALTLSQMLSTAAGSARYTALDYSTEPFYREEDLRAAVGAVGRFSDGDFVMSIGDVRVLALKEGRFWGGASEVVCAQPDADPWSVGGLGSLLRDVGASEVMTRVFQPGTVKKFLIGTDGVFNGVSRMDRYVGNHAGSLLEKTPEAVRDELVGALTQAVAPVRARPDAGSPKDGLDDAALLVMGA